MIHATLALPPGCEHYATQAAMPADLRDRLRQLVLEFGDTYAAYLVTEDDRQYFWGSQRRGVVGFRRRDRFVVVGDGLLADPDEREPLLSEFLAFARQNAWHTSYLNVPRNEINAFRRQGCQVTKCGEEPLVRLPRTRFQGKDWQWARRQESYCRRQGVEIREVSPSPHDPAYRDRIAPLLDAISRDHIARTLHRRELRFFVSQFSALDLRDRRLFVAERAGAPIAFIVCNPGLAGAMWAVEVYRRRGDAIRGVVPALIMHALRTMQVEDVQYVSLSLAPFLRCTPMVGDSVMFRWIANFWWRRLNSIYDMRGLFHFKSRFCPDYREMFLAAHPRITVRSLWSMAMMWQLFRFNPLRLLWRELWLNRNAERSSLAVPNRAADRLIRDLRVRRSALALDAPLRSAAASEAPSDAERPGVLSSRA
jgi:phosphatidylglycerol lysyltransferase